MWKKQINKKQYNLFNFPIYGDFMEILERYEDLKFAIRFVDIWKELKPSDTEMNEVIKYETATKGLDSDSLFCQPLQDYMEKLIDLVQNETGEWFFYVDIAGVLHDFVATGELSVIRTKSGYCVCFKK